MQFPTARTQVCSRFGSFAGFAWVVLWLLAGGAGDVSAQDEPTGAEKPKAPASQPVKKPSPKGDVGTKEVQDPVEVVIARRGDPVEALIQRIAQTVWKDEATRRRLLTQMASLEDPGNLPLAVGRAALESRSREVLPVLLDAWARGRVPKDARSRLAALVFQPFHQDRSIFDLVWREARRRGTREAELHRLMELVPLCVASMRFQARRTIDHDRWDAIRGIIALWNELGSPATETMLRGLFQPILSRITGGLDLEGRAAWTRWSRRLATIDGSRPRDALPWDAILRDALERSRSRLQAERERHRRDVTRLIALLAQHGVPAIAMLLNEDATIRDAVLVALESVNRGLSPEERAAAVKELIARLGDASQSIQVYESLLDATAVLGRDLPADLSKLLVEAVFERNCEARPELLDRQVLVLGRIGARSEGERLARIFTTATSSGTEASPVWVQVRRDVVRVLGVLGTGVETILRALEDPSSVVRGEAALVLKGFADRFGAPQGISADVFVTALGHEKDPSVRLRLLETIQAFVEARPDLATLDLLARVDFPGGGTESMRRQARIWSALALAPNTPEDVRVAARERVRRGLLEAGFGEITARVLMETKGEDAALMLGEALASAPWTAELKNEVHAHLGASLAPEKLWQLAVAMGLLNMESPPPSAPALANGALKAASDPKTDSGWMKAALEQCRTASSPWAAPWGLRLLERLAARDPAALDVAALKLTFFWRQWEVGRLSKEGMTALGGLFDQLLAREDGDPKKRAVTLRRWLRFSASRGDFASVREALRRLVESNAATDEERLEDELIRALASRQEAAKVVQGFPPGQAPPEGDLEQLWRVTRAVAVLLAPVPERDEEVVRDLAGPSAEPISAAFRSSAQAAAWWSGRLEAPEGDDDPWEGRPADLLRGALSLLHRREFTNESGPRFVAGLAAAFPTLHAETPVVWPPESNGGTADAIRATLMIWWRTLPVAPEFQAVFLKLM